MSKITELLDKNSDHQSIFKLAGELGESLGLSTYLVGGYIRDILMNKTANDIDIVVENEVKSSLTKFFKNFDNLKTIDDICGYNEFFSQYRDMIDSLIVRQYEEMSGVKVELVREGQIAKLYPPEVALKYGKINAESLADSKEFIDEFKVDYTKFPSGCPYKVQVIKYK